jgi:dihydrofolate reductase
MEVFLIAATTLDGYIGREANDRSFDWTSPEDKQFYIEKIKAAKHLVIGNTTLQSFRLFPRGTVCYIYTRDPSKFSAEGRSQAATYQPTTESPQALVARLEKEGVQQLAICGGASIYQLFMAAGVVTKIYLVIEPVLFGKGIKLFGDLPQECKLQLEKSTVLNQQGTVLLEYTVCTSN